MKTQPDKHLKGNLFMNIICEKCPHCAGEKVFLKRKKLFELPVMKERCEVCGYKYDREPGYFLGAMYLSYGLAVLQGIITFLICHFFFPAMATIWIPISIMVVIMLFSFRNYRLSRILYIHIFPW
jgi:hypothetical protein